MIETLLAKSEEYGKQSLLDHLYKCADKCYENAISIGCDEDNAQLAYLAGLLHDIGKCTDVFQKILNDEDTKNDFSHNEVSAYLIANYLKIGEKLVLRDELKDTLIRSVLYHHPVYSMKRFDGGFEYDMTDLNLSDNEIADAKDLLNACFKRYNNKFGTHSKYVLECAEERIVKFSNRYLSDSKSPRMVLGVESVYLTILNILKVSDIMSSNNDDKDYHYMFYNHIQPNYEFTKPEHYDNRFDEQKEIAKKVFEKDFSILEAPTGFGKTLMGVMYLLSNNRKGYWVCPRNTIARSIYKTVVSEVGALGLDKDISVALLLTNEYVYGDSKADIIVTNIDNYVRPMLRTDANDRAINMIFNNVIFDEFHEYVYDNSLMGMFCTVISMRSQLKGVKTLLMSATLPYFNVGAFPYNYCKLDDYCLITRNDIKNKSITDKKYKIVFDTKVDSDVRGKNVLVNVNSVSSCQLIYKSKCTDYIIHSRFEEGDLKHIEEALYNEHDKKHILLSKDVKKNSSFVSTNMISTGVDVSFANLIYNFVQPDRLIQLIGRVNRFSECISVPTICLSDSNKFNAKSEKGGLETNYDSTLSRMFYDYMKSKIANNSIVSLERLYEVREQFLEEKGKEIYAFIRGIVEESFQHLSDLNYTRKIKFADDGRQFISNKISLRNNGDFNSFYAIFKIDKSDGGGMTNSICVDDGIIKDVKFDSIIRNSINKYIKLDDKLYKKYFGNRFAHKKGNYTIVANKLMNKALCNETPLPIVSDYGYSKKLGIYLKELFK